MSQPFTKHLWGANTEVFNNPVHCTTADLASSHSATLEFAKIVCSGDAKISVDHSATLIIGELECENLTLEVSYSSTLRIRHLKCSGKVTIHVIYSSLFVVDGGSVQATTGLIDYASTGRFFAAIHSNDGVTAEHASTWQT